VRSLGKGLLWFFGITSVICTILYAFVFDVWTVPGDDPQMAASIEPTLSPGDTLLVSRSTGPDVGTLVRCADPDAPGRFVIARIVGHSNDTIETHDGMFTYNNKTISAPVGCDKVRVKHPTTGEEQELSCSMEEFGGVTHPTVRVGNDPLKHIDVQAGRVFLLSDNRPMHLDSRDYGQLDPQTCQRLAFRLWGAGGWWDTKRRLSIVW
jgi:signal peptidase I